MSSFEMRVCFIGLCNVDRSKKLYTIGLALIEANTCTCRWPPNRGSTVVYIVHVGLILCGVRLHVREFRNNREIQILPLDGVRGRLHTELRLYESSNGVLSRRRKGCPLETSLYRGICLVLFNK